jgi:hypothetical protein
LDEISLKEQCNNYYKPYQNNYQMNLQRPVKASNQENLLQLSKEELIKMLEAKEKEITIQLDLLKETFAGYQLLQQKVAKLEEHLKDLQNQDGYNATSSWISKIVFTLQQENRPLRSPELITLLEKREPLLAEHHNKVQYFSAFLSNAASYGRIIQQKVKGVRGYYYLLPEWLDEQSKAKTEYKVMML